MAYQSIKPNLRWRQFNLRTVFVLVTVMCVWFGWQVHRAKQQREVVQWMKTIGGAAYYKRGEGRFPSTDPSLPGSKWLRNILGADFVSNVEVVLIDRTEVRNLTPLSDLTGLQSLFIDLTAVTDLTHLLNLTDLQFLSASYSAVTDLTPLAKLRNLRELDLAHSNVSDVTPLAKLTGLQRVYLNGTGVSQEQVAWLRQELPRCKVLWYPPLPLDSNAVEAPLVESD